MIDSSGLLRFHELLVEEKAEMDQLTTLKT